MQITCFHGVHKKELLTLKGEHWTIRAIKLHAFTDDHDTLTEENEYDLFARNLDPCTGELFFLKNLADRSAIVIISKTPDYQVTTLTIKDGAVSVENGGYDLAVGYCMADECEAFCRKYLRSVHPSKQLITMSNTWGDCHGFSRVCEDFVIKEIDAAAEIGIDIVQIDDGWQVGSTADMSLRDEQNRRVFAGNFWELSEERFPRGMRYITDYAAEKKLKTGLWFAPDSHGNFALLERDTKVLAKAYKEWGMRFFKLDMYWIMSVTDRNRFTELLKNIHALGDDVAVQLDVTRNLRVNYLCAHEYGTVFVENRYAKTANSFPHRVLRNLWMISRYVPSSKFQFELINPDLYQESYQSDDPFVPSLYDMDYLFAAVMLSNPLFWMELQFLSKERRAQLKKIMDVWKAHCGMFAKCDVMPIGDKPSGRSFTGFYVSYEGKPQYLLLFREVTEESAARIFCPVTQQNAEILISNSDAAVTVGDGFADVKFSKPRSYALIELS